jgi:signal transduction histidine kinase
VTRQKLTVDTAIAVLVLTVSVAVMAAGGLGTPSPDAARLDGAGAALAVAASAPLIARRRFPLTGYVVISLATTSLIGLHYAVDFPFGCVVAVYTVAVRYGGDVRRTQRIAALAAVAAFVPVAGGVFVASGYAGHGMAPGVLFWAVAVGGAWIVGEITRLRRERIAELEERAERVEREAERERRLATTEERLRIARELHDSAGHAINVILMQAGAARLLHERDSAGSRRAIGTIEDVARGTITEIDRLVRALRDDDQAPAPADPAAIDELLDHHRNSGLAIATYVHGSRRDLPRSVAWAAYRILQEALTNAARHGRGSAEVAVLFRPDAVEIAVTNPAGTKSPAQGGGHGIVGMRERATLLGGTLQTHAEAGTFRLRARLPHSPALS